MPGKRSGRRDTITHRRSTEFARRDRRGRFKDVTSKGRALERDRRSKAKRAVKSGYGHRGDRAA